MTARRPPVSRSRLGWPLLLACVSLVAGATGAAAASAGGGRTTLHLLPDVVRGLGLEVVELLETAPVVGSAPFAGSFGFRATVDPGRPGLGFAQPPGAVQSLRPGAVGHEGGLELRGPGITISLRGFELRVPEGGGALAVHGADGQALLDATFGHVFLTTAGELAILNADLQVRPELAARLGRPELAGVVLGSLHAMLATDAAPAAGRGDPCAGDFTGTTDVALLDIASVSQWATESGVRVAFAPSAHLANVGTADVRWYWAIEPTGAQGPCLGQHPYLALGAYRVEAGLLTQIGASGVKHAFFATNAGCSEHGGGQVLFEGCEDTYSVTNNSDAEYLAPRAELTASTGEWTSLGSHFDGTPVDDARDHGRFDHPDLLFEHRLQAGEAELLVAGASYYVDAWYLVQGDVDVFNSMGWVPVTPTLDGGLWTFPLAGAYAQGSVVDAWVDPASPPAGTAHVALDTGEGHLRVAVRTEDLGGGVTRYHYVVQNLDYDRQIRSFSVPVDPGATVSGTAFTDVDDDAGNDWGVSVTAGAVTWSTPGGSPAANALDWGHLYAFTLEADHGPEPFAVTLGILEPGTGTELGAVLLTPGATTLFRDGFEAGDSSAWSGSAP